MKSAMTNMTANSNPKPRLNTPVSLHPNQGSVAIGLGLDVAKLGSPEDAVDAIESKLGTAAEEECARWFALSVLRHLRKEKWATPNRSGLDDASQKSLAKDCLAVEGFSASLRIVTKDARSKYRIVGFASSKKIERGVLATGTKGYKIAATIIVEAGLVERQAEQANKKAAFKKKTESREPELEEVEKAVTGRSVKRRGYFEDEPMSVIDTLGATSGKNQGVSMSKEEFADLDAAMSKNDAEITQQNWADQPNEDRWSRVLGLLAGVGFIVFLALLFL